MPNRIIREGLLDSEPLRAAGELAEVLFTRLMLVADDFGRFDGRVTVICRRCWPNGGPDEVDVLERLTKLIEHKLVIAYEVEGKPFIYIPKFKQRTRTAKSKFPEPPTGSQADDGQVPVNGQPIDGQMTAIGARSSSFVVRNSDSENSRQGAGTSTPKAAAHSLAKAQEVIKENHKAAQRAAPMPDWAKKFVPGGH